MTVTHTSSTATQKCSDEGNIEYQIKRKDDAEIKAREDGQ